MVNVLCIPNRQLSSAAQVYNSSFPLFRWFELLLPFCRGEKPLSMQGICVRYRGCPTRTRWSQDNGSVAEPANIFVEGLELLRSFQENIGQPVATRQLSDHHVAFSGFGMRWDL